MRFSRIAGSRASYLSAVDENALASFAVEYLLRRKHFLTQG